MELKLMPSASRSSTLFPLIVPYGIETEELIFSAIVFDLPLIVPYGIETSYLGSTTGLCCYPLIVPYGIETY